MNIKKPHEEGLQASALKSDQLQEEIQSAFQEQCRKKIVDYEQALKDLNSKILGITLSISAQCPELSEFLGEIPATIPNENNPEMTLSHLLAYYESLNSILSNYQRENPSADSYRSNDS